MSMKHAMLCLREFFERHNLPEPDGIEFRFADKVDAFSFDAALKMEFEQDLFVIDPADASRVSKVNGFKIEPTYRRHGAAYATTMLPAHHPSSAKQREN